MKCPNCHKEIGLFRETGAKGGSAKGKSKVRGDSEYYRAIRLKGVRKQALLRKAQSKIL